MELFPAFLFSAIVSRNVQIILSKERRNKRKLIAEYVCQLCFHTFFRFILDKPPTFSLFCTSIVKYSIFVCLSFTAMEILRIQ